MNQQVGTEQETRNIAAPFHERHLIAQPQRSALQLEYFGVVLADYKQASMFLHVCRQSRECFQAAIHALGLETGADLHQ